MYRLILKLIIIIICLGLICVNCKESNVSQGDITGYDNAPGPLIENGKLAITTGRGAVKSLPAFYLVYSDFLRSGSTRGSQFPVNARLNKKRQAFKLQTSGYTLLAHLR